MNATSLPFPDSEKVLPSAVRAPNSLPTLMPDGGEAKILLTQTDPIRMILHHQALVEAGYCVISALNGVEAMEELRREYCPRIAILDVELPLLRAQEICRRVDECGKAVYLILTGGAPTLADVVSALNAGASLVLPGPVFAPELVAYVKSAWRLLSRNSAQNQEQMPARGEAGGKAPRSERGNFGEPGQAEMM